MRHSPGSGHPPCPQAWDAITRDLFAEHYLTPHRSFSVASLSILHRGEKLAFVMRYLVYSQMRLERGHQSKPLLSTRGSTSKTTGVSISIPQICHSYSGPFAWSGISVAISRSVNSMIKDACISWSLSTSVGLVNDVVCQWYFVSSQYIEQSNK